MVATAMTAVEIPQDQRATAEGIRLLPEAASSGRFELYSAYPIRVPAVLAGVFATR
jgi:hypothetical protein